MLISLWLMAQLVLLALSLALSAQLPQTPAQALLLVVVGAVALTPLIPVAVRALRRAPVAHSVCRATPGCRAPRSRERPLASFTPSPERPRRAEAGVDPADPASASRRTHRRPPPPSSR